MTPAQPRAGVAPPPRVEPPRAESENGAPSGDGPRFLR
jgi:hypothetical protein